MTNAQKTRDANNTVCLMAAIANVATVILFTAYMAGLVGSVALAAAVIPALTLNFWAVALVSAEPREAQAGA